MYTREPADVRLWKDENAKLTDCYYEKKDWRLCKAEVSVAAPLSAQWNPEWAARKVLDDD